ncbi:MAG: glycerate kinase, partial [Anaerolineae bacterium]|nr:glycerate kinase [Anaerolineae bacterium]
VLRVDGESYDLRRFRRIYVVGAGKASAPMAEALEELLGERLTGGVVNVRDGYARPLARIRLKEAGHPVPDERGLAGTREMLALLQDAGEEDLVIAVISGGGSALLVAPVEGVTLADLQRLTGLLLRSGATIGEMNAVRKHLSLVKGGQLARAAAPAPLIALILSDVVGSPLDVIASGPAAPDESTFADAWAVLERYRLLQEAPPAAVAYLRRGLDGLVPETPKPGDPALARVRNVIVASNRLATLAGLARADELGMHTLLLSTYVEGEAREVGRVLAGVAREVALHGQPVPRPACIVAGGETTVTVRGPGLGGRNQELALGAALGLAGLERALVASLASDGSDGPTDAAGAIADGTTLARAAALGLDPHASLAANDSYRFFSALGDLLVTGPTHTNVNDLVLVMVG